MTSLKKRVFIEPLLKYYLNYFEMKKFILFCLLAGIGCVSEIKAQEDENVKGAWIDNRLVQGEEVNPYYWKYPDNQYFSIAELGVDLIWDNSMGILYVLKRVYFEGTSIYLDGTIREKRAPRSVLSDVFIVGDVQRTSVCLAEFVEDRQQFWLDVEIREDYLIAEITSSFSSTPIFKKRFERQVDEE